MRLLCNIGIKHLVTHYKYTYNSSIFILEMLLLFHFFGTFGEDYSNISVILMVCHILHMPVRWPHSALASTVGFLYIRREKHGSCS